MKLFKIVMKATSIKTIVLKAENEENALDKLDKLYFENEEIEFTDEDVVEVENTCNEMKFLSESEDDFVEL